MNLLLPSIITALGVLYIVSPIDIIPEFLGPLGLIDDLVVVLTIGFVWMVYLGLAVLETLMPVIKIMAYVVVGIIALTFLMKNAKQLKRVFK